MQTVINMNNEAALRIEEERFKDALAILSRALQIVQEELDSLEDDEQCKDMEYSVYSSQDLADIQARKKIAQRFEEMEPNEDFIYTRPIRATNLPEEDQEYVMSVILVFNMALSHHLTAMDILRRHDGMKTQDYQNRLQGALKLYELGFCMQMKGDVQMDMTYALAMVNNCAQIYKAMNKMSKAQKFFKHMLSSLMMMIENGEAESVDELEGFLWNASRLILREEVAAAA